jgi:hypothetical protein
MWTAAYAMSGVMKLEMGRWTKEHNDCTVFAYDPQTPHAAWRCFLTALDYAYNQVQDYKRGSDAKIGSNVGAWKVVVALAVDDARNRAGLPLVNQAFLEAAAAGKEMDVRGRIIAKRDGKGNVEPVFWHATRRR